MNNEELLRYSRHILLPGMDVDGQQKLIDSSVLIVGLGGLGCPVAMYLAAAGVGHLLLADGDEVDLSNLQRQIAHADNDIGRSKTSSTTDSVKQLNPSVRVTELCEKLEGKSLRAAVEQADIVVDASDNYTTRFAINQACVDLKKPLVSGAAIRYEGQVAVFDSRLPESPCYRCLYDDSVDDARLNCSESGVLAPLVGVIGSMQALEVIKLLSGIGETLAGSLLIFDAGYAEWRRLNLPKKTGCPVCS